MSSSYCKMEQSLKLNSSSSEVKLQRTTYQDTLNSFKHINNYLETYIKDSEIQIHQLDTALNLSEKSLEKNSELLPSINEKINTAEKIKELLFLSKEISSEKLNSAQTLKDTLLFLSESLTEEFYNNPQASMPSSIFRAFLLIKEHKGILNEAIPRYVKENLSSSLDNITSYYIEVPLQFAQKYLQPLQEYLKDAEQRDAKQSDPLTIKKIRLATQLKSELAEVKQSLTEDFYRNPNAPMISALFYLYLGMREHKDILEKAIPESNKRILGETVGTVVNSIMSTPLQKAGNLLYKGSFGANLDKLATSMTLEFPEQAKQAKKMISTMLADQAKETILPELIEYLEKYIIEAKKNTSLTRDKIQIAEKLKENLQKIKNQTERKDDEPIITKLIACILAAREEHIKVTRSTLLTSSKEHLGDTIGNIINYCLSGSLSWAGETCYHGQLGTIIDEAIAKIQIQVPGGIEFASITATQSQHTPESQNKHVLLKT